MRVYVLQLKDKDVELQGVFASFSAMTTWLKDEYNYSSEVFFENKDVGVFENDLDGCVVGYLKYDVIGEHSVTTDKIEFK